MTPSRFDTDHWRSRLDQLRATHRVPGATLAVFDGAGVHELAGGVLHRGTGVTATPDSVFQLGSIAKVYTATLVMRLAESGALDLDAPVARVLPELAKADPGITPRRLLSHTSGMTCDFTLDTGRGDDCLARYVEAGADVPPDCAPGEAFSYSSTGYNVLGRLVEVLTGMTWDRALRELLLEPLGLHKTMTLPEEVLGFRAAMGHLGEPGHDPEPAPAWALLPRSAGPYGGVCATAGDLVQMVRCHLEDGAGPDGTRVLAPETVAAMQQCQGGVVDRWSMGAVGWGLGWALHDWSGVSGFGHDGSSISQHAWLRVLPETGVAIALLTNGGGAHRLAAALLGELVEELAGVPAPVPFAPPARPPRVAVEPLLGTYLREGVVITVSRTAGMPRLRYELVGGMSGYSPPLEADLLPVSETVTATGPETVFACRGTGLVGADWMPVVFSTPSDGSLYCHLGMRAARKVS